MNERVNYLVNLHLTEYPNDTPTNDFEQITYLVGLFDIYERRIIVTWIHLLIGAWLTVNMFCGVLGLWSVYLPLITMSIAAGVFRFVTRDGTND